MWNYKETARENCRETAGKLQGNCKENAGKLKGNCREITGKLQVELQGN